MTVTVSEINKVWRLTNESNISAVYDDTTVSGIIEDSDNDLNWAASEIWAEKAAALQATMYDYSTEGERFTLSQVIDNAYNLAKYFNSRRNITSTAMVKYPVASGVDTLQTG